MFADLFRIAFVDGVFDFSCHEGIRVPLEGAQAGARAEIDTLAAILGADVIGRVFQFAAASSLIFRKWGGSGRLGQTSLILVL